jgi:hypothetical protein
VAVIVPSDDNDDDIAGDSTPDILLVFNLSW